jgi:hypothetical protein
MHTRGSIVCKSRPCLPKGPTNSACMRTVVTATLQWQYLQTELILWIRLIYIHIIYHVLRMVHTIIYKRFTVLHHINPLPFISFAI